MIAVTERRALIVSLIAVLTCRVIAHEEDASGCGFFCHDAYNAQPWYNLTLATHARHVVRASIQCSDEDKVCERAQHVLSRMSNYKFTLPRRNLDRSVVPGDLSSMHHFIKKILLGQPVKITLLGGSVSKSAGTKSGPWGPEAYYMKALGWLNNTFGLDPKDKKVTLINKSIGGKTSLYWGHCVEQFVDPDTDWVIIDTTMNDWYALQGGALQAVQQRVASEHVVRSLLSMPNRPAVVLLNLFARKLAATGEFNGGLDETMQALGMAYGVPVLSFRNAVWQAMTKGELGFRMCDMWCDVVHPTLLGHNYLADIIVAFLQDVTLDVLLHHNLDGPAGRAAVENSLQQQGLRPDHEGPDLHLPPLLNGDSNEGISICTVGDDLRGSALTSDGWQWTDEGREKWGWLAEECGKSIDIKLSTSCELDAKRVVLGLGHLKSYENIGNGKVECLEGCSCEAQELAGYWDTQVSIDKVSYVPITQANECKIRITSDRNPDTGSCKFKLVSMYVSCLDTHRLGMLG